MQSNVKSNKNAIPSVTNAEYLSDLVHSNEFYSTSFPIHRKVDKGRTGYASFSPEDAKKNKVKSFCTSANILQIDGYMIIINKLNGLIDVDHACEAIYVYNLIVDTLPPLEDLEEGRVTPKINNFFRSQIVDAMAKLKSIQVARYSEKAVSKLSPAEAEIRRKKDISSMIIYVTDIYKVMDMSK